MFWDAVGALGTWAAVLVALFLPRFERRRQLHVSVKLDRCLSQMFGPGPECLRIIDATVSNVGVSDVVVANWGFVVEGYDELFLRPICKNPVYAEQLCPSLPKRLVPGDILSCGVEKTVLGKLLQKQLSDGVIQSDDFLYVGFVDSLGKKYKRALGWTVQECIDDAGLKVKV